MEDRLTVSTLLSLGPDAELGVGVAAEVEVDRHEAQIDFNQSEHSTAQSNATLPSIVSKTARVIRAPSVAVRVSGSDHTLSESPRGGFGSQVEDILPPLSPHANISHATTNPGGESGSFGAAAMVAAKSVAAASAGMPATAPSFATRIPEYNGPPPETDGAKAGGGGGVKNNDYEYYVTGNAGDVAPTNTSGGLAMLGGPPGSDTSDVDAAFSWMGNKADGGDFLVLRATGTDSFNKYIDRLVPALDSVATLIVKTSAGAHDPFVADQIARADAIFIAGGDQSNYINLWSDSPMEDAIYEALGRNIPIGGTSAGLAVLGEIDFSASNGTIGSSEALANPYDERVTLDQTFLTPPTSPLDLLSDTVTDSHLQQRDRMGRFITFVARADADGLASSPRGIGINEQTALLVEADGEAMVVGNPVKKQEGLLARSVYFLETTSAPATVEPGQPLTYTVQVTRASYDPASGTSDTFNLMSWEGTGFSYTISATAGVLSSSAGSIYG